MQQHPCDTTLRVICEACSVLAPPSMNKSVASINTFSVKMQSIPLSCKAQLLLCMSRAGVEKQSNCPRRNQHQYRMYEPRGIRKTSQSTKKRPTMIQNLRYTIIPRICPQVDLKIFSADLSKVWTYLRLPLKSFYFSFFFFPSQRSITCSFLY